MNAKIIKTSASLPMVPTGNKATRTTSSRSRVTKESKAGLSGFTLIEILIVLAIVSLVMSMGLPAIERVTYTRLNSTTRKFIGLIRTIRNDAILLNGVYRLAFDFEKNTYWVETQREFKLLSSAAELPPDKKKKSKKGEEPPSNFMPAEKFAKVTGAMPAGIVAEGVLTERDGLRKTGIAYIHFFPNGFNDQAIIYLNKEGAKGDGYSLLVRPTSGRVEIFRERINDFN